MRRGQSAKAKTEKGGERPKQRRAPRPRLVVISAPSGAGKTTLCDLVLKDKDFGDVVRSLSVTTRPRRANERDGVHYRFVTPETFERMKKAGEFAEWAEVHGNLYGTPKAYVEHSLAAGKNVLFNIDVQGALALKKTYGARVLTIFVKPPSMEELEKRLVERKVDSPGSIETRLHNAYNELEWSESFQYQITNDDLDRAYQELKEILIRECR